MSKALSPKASTIFIAVFSYTLNKPLDKNSINPSIPSGLISHKLVLEIENHIYDVLKSPVKYKFHLHLIHENNL